MKENRGKRWMKYLAGICIVFAVIAAVYLVGTGLLKRTDVVIGEYTLSEDGETMTVNAGPAGSMGYIREVSVKRDGDRLCLIFYSAFGGLNSRLGTKSQFTFSVSGEVTEIVVYRGEGKYEVALQKEHETGTWVRANDR
jgi:hypothetical protein